MRSYQEIRKDYIEQRTQHLTVKGLGNWRKASKHAAMVEFDEMVEEQRRLAVEAYKKRWQFWRTL